MAAQNYGQLTQQQRELAQQASLGSREQAVNAYGAQNREPEKPGLVEKYGPMAISLIGAMSDENTKTEIRGGDQEARKAIDGLRAYVFRYKQDRYGKGKQFGIMAQDLERAGLGHAVVKTPEGKVVHGGKLATSNAALIASLGRRVAQLEKGRK